MKSTYDSAQLLRVPLCVSRAFLVIVGIAAEMFTAMSVDV